MAATVYLISGANRGVGLALVTHILTTRDDAFVYAGARDPAQADELLELAKAHPGRVSVVKCVSADAEGNAAIAKEIESRHGRLDTVIANAAVGYGLASVLETPIVDVEAHFRVNVIGPLVLFQAVHDLLRKSSKPRFVPISSEMGSLDDLVVKLPYGSYVGYGLSKAALNWVTRKIHFENEWLIVFPFTPGPVNTDMFQQAVADDTSGLMKNFIHLAAKPEQASATILNIIDNSTRKEYGGEFINIRGDKEGW